MNQTMATDIIHSGGRVVVDYEIDVDEDGNTYYTGRSTMRYVPADANPYA